MHTLQDYINKFEAERLDVYSEEHQQEIYNDLLRFVRILRPDEDARKIQAVPRIIKILLKKITASELGVAKGRYDNFCSNIRSALNKVALEGTAYQTIDDLPEAWQLLLKGPRVLALVEDPNSDISKYMRNSLNGFAKEAAAFGVVDPAEVHKDIFPDLLSQVEEMSFKKNPKTILRNKVVAWNNFHDAIENWPGEKITLPGGRQFTIDVEDMHPKLQQEIKAYKAYMLDPMKYAVREQKYRIRQTAYNKKTVTLHVDRLRYAAACLVYAGKKLENLQAIKDLVNPDALNIVSKVYRKKKGLKLKKLYQDGIPSTEFMEKTSGEHAYLRGLRTICLNCYKVSGKVRIQLTQAVDNTNEAEYDLGDRKIKTVVKGEGLSLNNQKRVDGMMEDPKVFKEYLELSRKTMDQLEERRNEGVLLKQADYYNFQNAIGLTLLTIGSMRIGDLSVLNMEASYQSTPKSKKQEAKLVYRTRKSKLKKVMEIRLSKLVDGYLHIYLKHYRPYMSKGLSTDYLFPGQNPMKPISEARLSTRISRFVENALGVEYHCHLNRHLTGSMMVEANPNNVRLTSKLLGHAKESTTSHYYIQDQTDAAFKAKDELMKEVSIYALS